MRALVHSGGGSKGAYGAGVLNYLMGDLGIKYDIFCGVSVGAINCAFVSQFNSGDEKEAAKQLNDWWLQIIPSKIFKRWKPFGRWHALWLSSVYDSQPLIDLIKNNVFLKKIRDAGKLVSVGAVSLSSGKYTIFDQTHDSFIDAVIASASFPGMLRPIKIGEQLWIDGGVKEITPIKTAIDMGATEIDIIITSPETRVKFFLDKPNTMDVLKRALDLSTDKIMANDIEKAVMYNKLSSAGASDKKIVKINIIRPDTNLIEDLLNFDPIKIKEMIKKGYEDAKKKYIM